MKTGKVVRKTSQVKTD